MKVWITKYALTKGVYEIEAETCEDIGSPNMIRRLNINYSECYFREGKDWHKTKESAIKKAEIMRDKKIEALKKQIKSLENMKFE